MKKKFFPFILIGGGLSFTSLLSASKCIDSPNKPIKQENKANNELIDKVNSLFQLLDSSSQKINYESHEALNLRSKINEYIQNLKSFDLNILSTDQLNNYINSLQSLLAEANSFLNKDKNENLDKLDSKEDTVVIDTMSLDPMDKLPMETEVPAIPALPNFPFGLFNNANKHKYPEHASKFKAVDSKILYKELYDRTFSLKYLTKLSNGDLLSDGTGTAWLLDYHKYTNSDNKYKLFLGTNLHVLARFSNSLEKEKQEKLNYYDPTNDKVVAVALGKSSNVTNFDQKPNKTGSNGTSPASYFTNSQEFIYYEKLSSINSTTQTNAISEPKLVFAAVDFMNDEAIKNIQSELNESASQYKQYKASSNDIQHYKSAWDDFESKNKVPITVDFAVFEVDIDLEKADETFKSWVNYAIRGLDNYIDRLEKTEILPNQDKNVSKYMQTTDYVSASYDKSNQNNLWNAKDIYIAGYPNQNNTATWMQNNPSERYSDSVSSYNSGLKNKDTFAFATGSIEEKVGVASNAIINDNYWNRVMASWYGFQYGINFSSLYYGASGSLAYNEFGQMVGIYNSVTASVDYGDLLRSGGIAPFLQSSDIQAANNTIYAYNLIDGSNKSIYKNQKNSFRENLKFLYPNGFSDGSKQTKLFNDYSGEK
ncbi:Conserved hypothetical protein, predictedlipoprotein [Mycoplasmopsis agalactiae PG2]|uniref:DUF31 domain-containing protein n=1 Tax=Mycoplasmopsis agalactiae (strain NCTC 10123 / CIP 59.7 / PG2) TaxID=347257 RepID=A5IYA1_MYCAP|nr:DUF31 family protein [Mycoplasmopsis agalactiae]CAL59010.1 Conserved hypothetical protein, predictedlipoprotein [Mycoplasmopsis agalactiae PG2]